ncbi:uncharacterized protein C8R40DRAFT_1174731 [Lentinula edodes]|uniref:uncharacterized protein n=1 Tax=Lentinula edodes TaxID=5353 RepID=UPI001E8EA9CD|nr:uncharacterized protein C8R40DRAFT_1174731 [Lentinula edodes]KAH7871309.1 hypothetical protein C8R40DRAFT_1174731 [Lentinula edodes]
MYTGSDSKLFKRPRSEEVLDCSAKVRVVPSSASSPLIRQQQERINELEQEVQALNEEVSGLTYCEDVALERAKTEVAQLYKNSLNFQAEIFRLKAQNNALNERLTFIQTNDVQKQKTEVAIQTDMLYSSIPAGRPELHHIATQTSLPQHTDIVSQVPPYIVSTEPMSSYQKTLALEYQHPSTIAGAFDEWVKGISRALSHEMRSLELDIPLADTSVTRSRMVVSQAQKDIAEEGPWLEINSRSSIVLVDLVQYPVDATSNQQALLWFPDAFAYVNVDLGAEYQNLVSTWIDLERTTQWRTNPKVRLPTLNRPSLLAEWVDKKRYKSRANEPNVEDCGIDFAENVKSWWASFQPAWRQGPTGEKSSSLHIGSHEWKSIDKFGLNGWFGIVVCLKWWGTNLQYRSVEDKTEGKSDWLKIVGDVRQVMEALVRAQARLDSPLVPQSNLL